jgi:hypothetical protein
MPADEQQVCNYCGVEDELRQSVFFSHPYCFYCLRAWYEQWEEGMTRERLGEASRRLRQSEGVKPCP